MMTTMTVAGSTPDQINRDAAIRKVWWRLIPFLFVLYIFNYLDRINIGFAALSMNKDLVLTATTFGLANSTLAAFLAALPGGAFGAAAGLVYWMAERPAEPVRRDL